VNLPTLEDASVRLRRVNKIRYNLEASRCHLLSVVDFPDEGLPTKPIKGSRGMVVEVSQLYMKSRVEDLGPPTISDCADLYVRC
jgi:hypothetical protein